MPPSGAGPSAAVLKHPTGGRLPDDPEVVLADSFTPWDSTDGEKSAAGFMVQVPVR